MRFLRESYAAKLFAGLLGTVGVLLFVTLGVVRSETGRQVQEAADRAARNAASQLVQVEEIRQEEVSRRAEPLVMGRRMLALLEAALEDDASMEYFVGEVTYETQLRGLGDALLAFSDSEGRPFLTLHGDPMAGEDPADLEGAARAALGSGGGDARSYRVLDGTLFVIRTRIIQLVGPPIGTLSLGAPVLDEEVARVGEALGVEVCLVVGGACVAGTVAAREHLASRMVEMAGAEQVGEIRALDGLWSVRSESLVTGDPGQGHRVIAVPLGPVIAPFQRITRALILGGGVALVLAVLVGMVLSRGLTRPVRALVSATGRVAEGDYEAEVPVTTRDELGVLAAAFNDMTHGLLLKERLRSILDVVSSREVAEELLRGGLDLGGENREVTVLFADIRGFSALTEGMEPQRVITFLNECMQRLSDAVVEHGGHVDKFVGDELMAVFNVPKEVDDHTGRALRAALAMQAAMKSLNEGRRARGEGPIGIGVGVNAGVVVAGKMGSESRNNYTVLGDAVNLGARLCSAAGPGEVLATRACVARAACPVEARSLGARGFKGFSEEIEVLAVEAVGAPARVGSGPAAKAAGTHLAGILAVLGALLAPDGADAQRLPTLQEKGVEYLSPGGAAQLTLSGQLDLELLAPSGAVFGLARFGSGEPLFAPRLRLFADLFLGDRLYGLMELRADRGDAPTVGTWDARLEQAFVRLALDPSGRASFQVGRFASPFGSYPLRHLTEVDPFVRPPLPYDYRTVMCAAIAPGSTGGFLTWRDRPGQFRHVGSPPIWGVPYQWGAMLSGGLGAVAYRLAVMNSAPSSSPEAWAWDGERMRHPSLVAGLGWSLSPSLTLGASFNRGPWMEELKSGAFGAQRDRWDYMQTVTAIDLTWARGPLMARLEGIHDRWQVPNMEEAPVELGGSLEVQADVAPGVFLAGRVGILSFRPVETANGPVAWDHDVQRYEASVGYRLDRNAGLLVSAGTTPARSALEGRESLVAARMWWRF